MTFDYGRLFVISLLGLSIFNVTEGDNKYKYAESDERIHRLEDYVSHEILSYLRLLRLENEQRLRLLGQTDTNGGQQFSSDYGDLEWSQEPYDDSDWLQNSYDLPFNPGQMALWLNSPFANRRFLNSGGVRQSKIPPLPLANSERMRNMVPSFPSFSFGANGVNGMPASFRAPFPPEGMANNGYMQLPKVPLRMNNDQLDGQIASLSPDNYNFKLGQLPGSRKGMGTFPPELQREGGYQIASTISSPPEGSMTSPSALSSLTAGNIASATMGSINGLPKRSSVKMSSVPNSGQTTIDIDSTDSENTFETGVRSLTPKRKMQEDTLSGVKGASSIAAGETTPGNKKYRVLLLNGDEGEEVSFDDIHKKLFSFQGVDSTSGTNAVATASSSSSRGRPQHSFQSVSVSNNGKGATIMSSPSSKSTNTISLQSGDESSVSSVMESQPRRLGTNYNNSGFGSFEGVKGLVTNGFQNLRLT